MLKVFKIDLPSESWQDLVPSCFVTIITAGYVWYRSQEETLVLASSASGELLVFRELKLIRSHNISIRHVDNIRVFYAYNPFEDFVVLEYDSNSKVTVLSWSDLEVVAEYNNVRSVEIDDKMLYGFPQLIIRLTNGEELVSNVRQVFSNEDDLFLDREIKSEDPVDSKSALEKRLRDLDKEALEREMKIQTRKSIVEYYLKVIDEMKNEKEINEDISLEQLLSDPAVSLPIRKGPFKPLLMFQNSWKKLIHDTLVIGLYITVNSEEIFNLEPIFTCPEQDLKYRHRSIAFSKQKGDRKRRFNNSIKLGNFTSSNNTSFKPESTLHIVVSLDTPLEFRSADSLKLRTSVWYQIKSESGLIDRQLECESILITAAEISTRCISAEVPKECCMESQEDLLAVTLGQCCQTIMMRSKFTDVKFLVDMLTRKMNFREVHRCDLYCNQGVMFPALKLLTIEITANETSNERHFKVFYRDDEQLRLFLHGFYAECPTDVTLDLPDAEPSATNNVGNDVASFLEKCTAEVDFIANSLQNYRLEGEHDDVIVPREDYQRFRGRLTKLECETDAALPS